MDKLWYRECNTGRRFIIKLEPGTRITAALVDFASAKQLPFASLVSAVGSVRNSLVEKSSRMSAFVPVGWPSISTSTPSMWRVWSFLTTFSSTVMPAS